MSPSQNGSFLIVQGGESGLLASSSGIPGILLVREEIITIPKLLNGTESSIFSEVPLEGRWAQKEQGPLIPGSHGGQKNEVREGPKTQKSGKLFMPMALSPNNLPKKKKKRFYFNLKIKIN